MAGILSMLALIFMVLFGSGGLDVLMGLFGVVI